MTDYKAIKLIKNGVEYCFPSGSIADLYRFKYIIVGGGGGGGSNGDGGGGGGGDVCFGDYYTIDNSVCIVIGAGGAARCNGGNSYMGQILARGGYAGNDYYYGGCSGNLNSGGYRGNTYGAGGGAGAGGDGCSPSSACNGGYGGPGLCGYGGGGGGFGYRYRGYGADGGGTGGNCSNTATSATQCGSGGGGHCASGGAGAGAPGIGIICYKTDGEDGFTCATGGTVTTSGDYTVHTFTSNGTFTIVS